MGDFPLEWFVVETPEGAPLAAFRLRELAEAWVRSAYPQGVIREPPGSVKP